MYLWLTTRYSRSIRRQTTHNRPIRMTSLVIWVTFTVTAGSRWPFAQAQAMWASRVVGAASTANDSAVISSAGRDLPTRWRSLPALEMTMRLKPLHGIPMFALAGHYQQASGVLAPVDASCITVQSPLLVVLSVACGPPATAVAVNAKPLISAESIDST